MKKLLILLVAGFTFASCNTLKSSADKDTVELSGKLEKLGMSTFQYGTHTLNTGSKTYALKSTKVSLDSFEGKQVTLKGSKVAGYPVENGPELIEVTEVSPL
ncbi:hypothetical protein [Pedobacter metabolipauper]|uniref:Uncharacterized protein n=1 Tax=Pedobacter metabolipauper TaxID=425513 RepID=A0A4R6SXV5_9SPHI|nr:hypothetical protein [Pedobacter metabolipauper]TDQ11354.1 hypothetical protein ATK78_0472 [Pedobacter metabolipauper]